MREYATNPAYAAANTIRLFLCYLIVMIIGIAAIISLLCISVLGKRELKIPVGFWFARKWASLTLWLVGVPIIIEGDNAIDWTKGYIVIANHQSTLDILAVIKALRQGFRFVAKREVLKYPFIGLFVWLADQILINREDRAQAVSTINEALKRDPKTTLFYFAEGHRTRTGKLQEFRMGGFHTALQTGLPILPIALGGGYDILEKGSLLRFKPARRIRLRFCPIILPSRDMDPKKLRDEVRAIINTHLEQRYRDPLLTCIRS